MLKNSGAEELLGETVFNTVYGSQQPNQNAAKSTQHLVSNPAVQSKHQQISQKKNNIDNNMSSIRGSNNPMPPNQIYLYLKQYKLGHKY